MCVKADRIEIPLAGVAVWFFVRAASGGGMKGGGTKKTKGKKEATWRRQRDAENKSNANDSNQHSDDTHSYSNCTTIPRIASLCLRDPARALSRSLLVCALARVDATHNRSHSNRHTLPQIQQRH